MKNLLFLVCICLFSCQKSVDVQQAPKQEEKISKDPQVCDFGITEFNTTKRAPVADEFNSMKGKPSGGGNNQTSTSSGGSVIYLDFDGAYVSGTMWNYSGNLASANLTTAQVAEIVNRVSNDYSPFNVTVTTNQADYDAANRYKRIKVIVTETWEWYGKVGGVSYIGSFTWGDNTPSFVFSLLLNYNVKYISEAISHEAGHTLGLYHQSKYDASCTKLSEYNSGVGSGETGWAPIMGVGYYQNETLWHNGQSGNGCSSMQDDVAIITSALGGAKADDYSNTTNNAKPLSGTLDGLINNNKDVDFFYVDNTTSKTISVLPFSVGANNAGANLDLVLKVYSNSGALVSTINDPALLSASTTLAPGKYYLSVSTASNQYANNYGMLGRYNITIQ
ncbi:MAG: hypothetical protein ABUT20_06595 [Bacteroidota bacterium]